MSSFIDSGGGGTIVATGMSGGAADVAGTTLTTSTSGTQRQASSALTAGTTAGTIRSDIINQYEVRVLGATASAVYYVNARLVISYA